MPHNQPIPGSAINKVLDGHTFGVQVEVPRDVANDPDQLRVAKEIECAGAGVAMFRTAPWAEVATPTRGTRAFRTPPFVVLSLDEFDELVRTVAHETLLELTRTAERVGGDVKNAFNAATSDDAPAEDAAPYTEGQGKSS